MATAHINAYERLDQQSGEFETDGQCFLGYCSQNRVDITTTPASFSSTPAMTVAAPTEYLSFEVDAKTKIYAGPSTNNDTVKQARAIVVSTFIAVAVKPDDVVHVWLA